MIGSIDPKSVLRRALQPVARGAGRWRTEIDPAHWGLTVQDDGRLSLAGRPLDELVSAFGSPLHVVDLDRLDRCVSAAVSSCGPDILVATHGLVTVGPLVQRLHGHGVIGVVESTTQLRQALRLGIDPARLVFACATPTPEAFTDAFAAGIRTVVVSSQRALDLALGHVGRCDEPVNVLVELGSSVVDGFDRDSAGRALEAVDAAAAIGGLRIRDDRPLATRADVAELAARIADDARVALAGRAAATVLVSTRLLAPTTAPLSTIRSRLNRFAAVDLPTPSVDDRADMADLVGSLRTELQARIPAGSRLLVEPGPALTADHQLLLTSVLDVHRDAEPVHVVLDAGVNLADRVTTEYHHLFNTSCAAGPAREPFRFVGPICTPADVLYTNWRLPRVEVGDVLAIMDTGAGFVGASTSFSFPRPAVVGRHGDEMVVLRRAEQFDDLVALDVLEPPA